MLTSSRESDGPLLREALRLGAVSACATWTWVAALDLMFGRPWHAFTALGGIVPFTVAHLLLNVAYAMVAVAAARASHGAPTLVIALIFGFVMMEIGFAMLAVVLGQTALGTLAWTQIFGGSLLGLAIMLSHLLRNYPMAHLLHRAEEER